MATSAATPERRRDWRLALRAAALAFAVAVAPASAAEQPTFVAQAEDAPAPGGAGVMNWLGNLIGRGLPTTREPESPPAPLPWASGDTPADESVVAPVAAPTAVPATPQQASPATDATTSLGLSLVLGKAPPTGTAASPCIAKARETVLFCVEPVEWPEAMRSLVWVSSHMYQGTYAVVRYDNGRASFIHALIPSLSYDAVVAWYAGRWGKPETWDRRVVRLNEPKAENPTSVWQHPAQDDRPPNTLEIRQFDDTRGGFADGRHGVVMLYTPTSTPIFPQLSTVELMALRIVEDQAERPEGVSAPTLPEASSKPVAATRRPAPPPPAEATITRPTAVPDPPPPPAEANPFNPALRAAPRLDAGTVEAPAASAGRADTREAATAPPPEAESADPGDGVFATVRQFFGGAPASPRPADQQPPAAARADRTPDIRPPVYGFFTRLIRTYTEDGSEIANADGSQPSQGQMLRDVPLAIDDNLALGMTLPAENQNQQRACFDKTGASGQFCLLAPTWPPDVASALGRTADLPSVGLAALRFDLGKASHIQLRFLGTEFERVTAFFTELYGPPTERAVRRTAVVGDNPAVLWRSVDSRSGGVSTLEIRRYDDLLPGAVEARVGVIRVFRDTSASLFPPLTPDDIAVLR